MSQARALVVDDEPDLRELLGITLSRMGLEVTLAEDLGSARRHLSRGGPFALCLTDMRLPDGNGLTLIREISRDHPDLPVAMITAYGKVEDAVEALKLGAFDFVSKPVDLEVLRQLARTALQMYRNDLNQAADGGLASPPAASPGRVLQPHISNTEASLLKQRLIGESEAISQVRRTIGKLARSQAPVLIYGDSGSGKELAARLIHDLGPRADRPFIVARCGAIPTEGIERSLFGNVCGSLSGAQADHEGLFQIANGGTLLLDEVARLPLHLQVKLLQVLQEKSIRPIGARSELPVDVRILSASDLAIRPLVEAGEFRSDLYFRLNVIELHMPALHERPEDIPLLVRHYLKTLAEQCGEAPRSLDEEAMQALVATPLSGNIRELINLLHRAITLAEGPSITRQDLDLEADASRGTDQPPTDSPGEPYAASPRRYTP